MRVTTCVRFAIRQTWDDSDAVATSGNWETREEAEAMVRAHPYEFTHSNVVIVERIIVETFSLTEIALPVREVAA